MIKGLGALCLAPRCEVTVGLCALGNTRWVRTLHRSFGLVECLDLKICFYYYPRPAVVDRPSADGCLAGQMIRLIFQWPLYELAFVSGDHPYLLTRSGVATAASASWKYLILVTRRSSGDGQSELPARSAATWKWPGDFVSSPPSLRSTVTAVRLGVVGEDA